MANITPTRPVLNTTSIVPHDWPVSTYKSLANVIPGSMFVKKMYTALATTCWLNIVQSDTYRCWRFLISCFNRRNGPSLPVGVKYCFHFARLGVSWVTVSLVMVGLVEGFTWRYWEYEDISLLVMMYSVLQNWLYVYCDNCLLGSRGLYQLFPNLPSAPKGWVLPLQLA